MKLSYFIRMQDPEENFTKSRAHLEHIALDHVYVRAFPKLTSNNMKISEEKRFETSKFAIRIRANFLRNSKILGKKALDFRIFFTESLA